MTSKAQEMLIENWCRYIDKYGFEFIDLAKVIQYPGRSDMRHLTLAYHYLNERPFIAMAGDILIDGMNGDTWSIILHNFKLMANKRIPKALLKKLPDGDYLKNYEHRHDGRIANMMDSLMDISNKNYGTKHNTVFGTETVD